MRSLLPIPERFALARTHTHTHTPHHPTTNPPTHPPTHTHIHNTRTRTPTHTSVCLRISSASNSTSSSSPWSPPLSHPLRTNKSPARCSGVPKNVSPPSWPWVCACDMYGFSGERVSCVCLFVCACVRACVHVCAYTGACALSLVALQSIAKGMCARCGFGGHAHTRLCVRCVQAFAQCVRWVALPLRLRTRFLQSLIRRWEAHIHKNGTLSAGGRNSGAQNTGCACPCMVRACGEDVF